MAAASDKARFFLEQSVPELREYERKKIFSTPEISSIAKQRSDFEHKINARGSTATDFARYAEFEINVETLRKRRVKRLGIKSTNHTGQRRIFFVFDRGTKKHPGDVGLWLQSIEFARKQKAHKKLSQIFTNVLRLHPTKPELWIYAAQFAMEEHGDMTEARSYMQRGRRFCKNKKVIWLEYARLEISYIAKLHARRQILGIREQAGDEIVELVSNGGDKTGTPNMVTRNPDLSREGDEVPATSRKVGSTTARGGGIPIAIFDGAMSQFRNDPEVVQAFVDLLGDYDDLPAARGILRHISDELRRGQIKHWIVYACEIHLLVFGVSASSAEYPNAFRQALKRLKEARTVFPKIDGLDTWAKQWLQRILEDDELDPALQTVAKAVQNSFDES